MTDLQIIKNKIYEERKIEYLLDQLGCKNIKTEQNGYLYTAGLPDSFNSDNNRTIQVKNKESLSSYVRSKDIQGDIFNLVAFLEGYDVNDIYNSKITVCNIMGYPIEYKHAKKIKDWNEKLHNIQKKRQKEFTINLENIVIPEITLEQYINIPVYEWYKEGLSLRTQYEFELGMDISGEYEKIIFPIRDEFSKLLTVKARFLHQYEDKFKNIKYYYQFPYNRQLNLFNLHRAKEYIQDEVYIFEGEKTTMYAWQYGIRNCVSTQGKEISPMQIRKLIELNCKLVFVFDKDVKIEFFEKYKKQLKSRVVYCVLDKDDLLGFDEEMNYETGDFEINKNSPTDLGKDVFLQLINNREYRMKI